MDAWERLQKLEKGKWKRPEEEKRFNTEGTEAGAQSSRGRKKRGWKMEDRKVKMAKREMKQKENLTQRHRGRREEGRKRNVDFRVD